MSNYETRPAVMDKMTESQLKELEFQSDEYDKREFFEVAAGYGWDDKTVQQVWDWFQSPEAHPTDDGE